MINLNTTEKELTRRWVQTWQQTGKALMSLKLAHVLYENQKCTPDILVRSANTPDRDVRVHGLFEMTYIFDHLILLCDLKGKPEIAANLRQRLRAVEHDAL
ncbi:hypothetical protein U27_01521 [Candidatus Vecturithrix granuli]|uniref:Uncharacterized protein n=1 Tax=Vecturithrix granuli TaxID=1499967 RepID=A0A081CAL5_VECG1|nr:hypothetical protein U27_01521 [Candidatus Vecturithrix granuli]